MDISKLERAQLVYSERRMAITIDFKETSKHEVPIVISYRLHFKILCKLSQENFRKFSKKFEKI